MKQSVKEKLWTKDFTLVIIINFLLFMNDIMFFNTFPMYLKQELGLDEHIAGMAAVFFSVTAVLLRPLIGWLLDTGKRKSILIIGFAGMFAMPFGYLLSSVMAGSAYMLSKAIVIAFVCRIIHGASHSFANTAAATTASDALPKMRFAEGMGYFGMATALATSIAPALSLALKNISFTLVFITASAFIMLAFILSLFLETHQVHITEKKPFTLKGLIEPSALPASVTCLTFLLMYGALQNFLSSFAESFNLPSGGTFFLITAIVLVLVRIALGRVSDKKGEGIFVYTCNASMFLAFILLALFPTKIVFYISAVLAGYAYGGIEPALQSMAVHTAAPEKRGAANSTFLCSYDIGLGCGAGIAGMLISAFGYRLMFTLLSAAAIVSVLIYVFWGRSHDSSMRHTNSDNHEVIQENAAHSDTPQGEAAQ